MDNAPKRRQDDKLDEIRQPGELGWSESNEAAGSPAAPSAASIEGLTPEQAVLQKTFAERLYGSSPDIDQRRDALHTMALIFAAAETDSAREATFEDMFKEFCAVPRMAIFDSLTRHTGAEIATNYTFETEEFFEVEAVERLLAKAALNASDKLIAAPTQPKAQVGSIDTPEFSGLLADFGHNWTNGDEEQKTSRAALIAHIDAWAGSRAGDAAPDGWRLVPEQPTNKMTAIGQDLRYKSVNSIGAIYRAMLAAAPAPGKQAGKDQDGSA